MMGLSLFLRLLWVQSTATERSGFQTVFYCFKAVLKQLKEINKPRPDGGPRTFWVRTALTDRQKLTDLRPAQLMLYEQPSGFWNHQIEWTQDD